MNNQVVSKLVAVLLVAGVAISVTGCVVRSTPGTTYRESRSSTVHTHRR